MTFADLAAHPTLQQAIAERGYTEPTPVQAAVLAPEHAQADLLVSAATGSGKTLAFGLLLARTLLGDAEKLPRAKKPLALVIVPTRELALQVQRELAWLWAPALARTAACVGGMPMGAQLRALADGAHLVVGTPGRLVDHLERRSLSLDDVQALVLDEADEMLDMGFREELERILRDAPAQRRTLLFSATIPDAIAQLAARYQRDAHRIAATPPRAAHPDIEYRAHLVAAREREHAVVNVLRDADAPAAIVFCATREDVNHLSASLVERGFPAVALSGELTQAERLRALTSLRDGRARVLVATDVAARGLDLPEVGLVLHADLPNDPQMLQHRSGRTGRAGRKGVAVVLVPASRRRAAERIFHVAGVRPRWAPVPPPEGIRRRDGERIAAAIFAQAPEMTEEDAEVIQRVLAERTPEQLAALLVSRERARLPEPEDLPLSLAAEAEARQRRAPREHPRPGGAASAPAPAGTRPGRPASWFSVNVGRMQGADPKWLLPMLCRRGEVTKAEIGAIRILADETRFEIAARAAERFGLSAARRDRREPQIRVRPCAPPDGAGPARAATGRPRPGPTHPAARRAARRTMKKE